MSVPPPGGNPTIDRTGRDRIGLRPRDARHGRQRGSARGQMQELFGGRVDEGVAPPHPSQTRMCRFPASGSSWESLARGGVDDTIRDSPAKKISKVSPRFHSCQYSYPLSFRGQVCENSKFSPMFPVNGSLHMAPLFPRSGPGKSGSPMS